MRKLNNLFNPKTIALIGASDKESTIGRIILTNLLQSKDRKIFPVNPHKKKVLDIPAYPSIADVRENVELAVIATPAPTVPEIVEECGKAGVGGIVIISAGFKEIGEQGVILEHQISEIRKKYGMRILGPNCIGFLRPHVGLNTTFITISPSPGDIAFISQSGALGDAILDWAIQKHIGFSMFASLGSMLDVDFGDLIDFLGDDKDTRSILIYMEGVGNARKFMSAARAFALQKPIIVLKPGRFNESAKAARSHTGAMAGDDAIYEAAFKRIGVVRVKEIGELFDAATVLDSRKLPRGPKLAIITNAGGPGVMATDTIIELGGELAKLSDETVQELNKGLPDSWSKGNPVDILGDADTKRYKHAITTCMNDPGVDGILALYVPLDTAPSEDVAQVITEIGKGSQKPITTAWMGGVRVSEARETFIHHNIPTYETPEGAVRAYMNMVKYKRNLELLYETPAALPRYKAPSNDTLKALIRNVVQEGRTLLNEKESKDFFANYGIPTNTTYITRHVEEALDIAKKLGYPLAIKIVSPDISHKSDVGGVVTGINSDQQLWDSFGKMITRVKKYAPNAAIEGVSVQKMIEGIDYELILGAKKDKDFGSVILFGMGGITAELIRDFSIGLPPLNQTLAKRLIEETKAYKLIQGWRGKTPADLGALEETIVNFSNLVVEFPEIAEIDINPLCIANGKPYALDGRIILDKDCVDAAKYQHLVIMPYPSNYIIPWEFSDGTNVLLRPIRPEDEPLEHELLSSLSPESLRTRFFSPNIDISHEKLILFCNIDYDRHIAMVGEIMENGKRKIIGVARLIINSDFNSAEFAVLVHDNYQGKRLGYKLMEVLIDIGREKGLYEIYGEVLTDNKKMLSFCKKLGFTAQGQSGGTTTVTLRLR